MSKGTTARAILVGRMGAPLEVKTIPGGTKVGNVSVACTSGYGDKAVTSWFRIQIFGDKRIEAISTYATKGTKIFVDGELRIREYQKEGITRTATEVVVGYDGTVEIIADGADGQERPAPAQQPRRDPPPRDSDLDDDVPF